MKIMRHGSLSLSYRGEHTSSTINGLLDGGHAKSVNHENGKNGGFCLRMCRWCFPLPYLAELKQQLILALPAICFMVLSVFIGITALIFCGHLGTTAMDTVGLSNTIINITVLSMGEGLAEGCDTLFTQAFGSKNKKLMGIYLQRALVIMFLASLLSVAVILNIEQICVALGQDREVSRFVGRYLTRFTPGAVAYFLYIILMRYLQDMNHLIPTMVTVIFGNVVNVVSHYVFLYVLEWGTDGSAYCQSLSYIAMLTSTLMYLLYSRVYVKTWSGWSLEMFNGWAQIMRLGLGGILSLCLEWWCFEFGVFLAGLLGKVDLAALSMCLNVDNIVYNVPAGIGIAASIRVGHHLGAGDALAAKTASHVALTICLISSIISLVLLETLSNQIPKIFTHEPDVIKIASEILPVVGLYNFFDNICAVSRGVFRGSGRQMTTAAVVFLFYYCIGLPLAACLMLLTSLRGIGFWVAMSAPVFIMVSVMPTLIMCTNWHKQVAKAIQHTSYKPLPESDENTGLLHAKNGDHYDTTRQSEYETVSKKEDKTKETSNIAAVIIEKSGVIILVLALFASGLGCRLFLPLPPANMSANQTSTDTPWPSNQSTVVF